MRLIFLMIFLFFFCAENKVFGDDERCHRSTEGKEFWFGFMEGRNDNGNVHYIEITVTAREETSFSVFIGKSVVAFDTRTVLANNSVQIRIPLNLAEATGSEDIQEKGIHLVAENPVNVYALNWDRNSADVAVIYPFPSLGKEYFTMCYEPNVHNRPAHGRNSEFLIVASEDNTTVNITPSVVTDGGKAAGVSFSIILNKGEVYQVQSLNQRNLAGQGDLTGSYIESDKPVAVYSGNFSTTVPSETGMSGYDHLYEQMPPPQTWGREYYAVPLLTRQADRYRVMSSEDNTTIQIGNGTPVVRDRGKFYEFTLNNNEPSRIFADKPVMVAQFSQSNKTDQNFTGGDGDPFMIILSSVSQSKNDVTFVAYNPSQIRDYYVKIVTLTSEKDNIFLDGEPLGSFFIPFPGTNYSYTQHGVYSGRHTLINSNPNRGFLAYVYGYGGYESYGYGVGFNLDIVLDLGQSIYFDGDTLQICEKDEIVLDAGPYFDEYIWNTGDTTQKITVTKQGKYWAQGTTVDGCTQSDSIYILIEPIKKPELGVDSAGCALKLILDAGEGYARYEWNTNKPGTLTFSNKTNISADIQVDDWGVYAVTYKFTTPDNCVVEETLELHFWPLPTSEFKRTDDDPDAECAGYTQILEYMGNATPGANYYWDFDGCAVIDSSVWNQREISMGILTSVPVVKLLVEENGCWSTLDSLKVKANPDFTMNTQKSRGCDSAIIYLSGELKTADDLLFEWNFGDGSPVNNLQNPSHFYKSVGSFDVGLLITNQINGCKIGFTIEEMVRIFPTPEVEIAVDTDFCNDKTAEIFYVQNIDSSFCTWQFEGAHQTGGMNDSIIIFLDKQTATIRLQVEEFGCKSKWAEATAKRKPFFDFSTDLTEGCQPLQVLAKASTAVENIEFNWLTDSVVTSGNEQNFILSDAGNYDFTLATKSVLTGCSDTLTKFDLVQVHPKPFAQFEVDFPVAIIEHATLSFTNLTPEIEIFSWNFGDGFSSDEINPRHTYKSLGKFPVQLIVESEFGCSDTGMMEIEVLPFNVYTPNAFRPNSEIPENREFMPVGVGIDPNGFQLQIFNRWGESIFESNSPDYKWGGTTKNNKPAPIGNYLWKADFKDIQGFDHSMKGQIMLIR